MENAKSKTTAGLLGIFLGWLGIHNFYLGYKKKALIQCIVSSSCTVLYLILYIITTVIATLTLGIGAVLLVVPFVVSLAPLGMAIWGLVEAIMIFTGKINVDANGNALI